MQKQLKPGQNDDGIHEENEIKLFLSAQESEANRER